MKIEKEAILGWICAVIFVVIVGKVWIVPEMGIWEIAKVVVVGW